jgi:hypothetical protein
VIRRRLWTVAAIVVVGLSACTAVGSEFVAPSPVGPSEQPAGAPLARPRVASLDPDRPRYDREQWQPRGWADEDGDSCNTREEVLISEARVPVVTGPGCKILAGEWLDPYSGRVLTSAAQAQIDHLVAIGDAHRSGGWAWPPERKVAFANDLADSAALNAVWGAENQRKADFGPDRWLPPVQGFRCECVASYARIKARWDLTVTSAEWAAIERVWAGCQ